MYKYIYTNSRVHCRSEGEQLLAKIPCYQSCLYITGLEKTLGVVDLVFGARAAPLRKISRANRPTPVLHPFLRPRVLCVRSLYVVNLENLLIRKAN